MILLWDILTLMQKFIKYENLDEYFISQNPKYAKQLRKIIEENAKKFKPEPNTISWLAKIWRGL